MPFVYLIPVLVVAAVVFFVIRNQTQTYVILGSQGVIRSRNLKPSMVSRLTEFAIENLSRDECWKIVAYPDQQGRIHWKFPSRMDRELAQRFRNYVINEV